MIKMGLNDSIKGSQLSQISGPDDYVPGSGLCLVVGHESILGEILELIEDQLDIGLIQSQGLELKWYTMPAPQGITTY